MDMFKLKPVLFIKPYSKTIEEVISAVQEIAIKNAILIYECENIAEANQILSQNGPSLIISSSAKPLFNLLTVRRKANKKNKNKTLLINKKQFNNKINSKFKTVGLTEQIIEPFNFKTVMHKISLLVRSIPTLEELENKNKKPNQLRKEISDKKEERK